MTQLSIIIPVLNEEKQILATLAAIEKYLGVEIIIVDGGSTDQTLEIVKNLEVKITSSPRGRAQQMNAGAQRASGEILLFLHADTRLPKDYLDWIKKSLEKPGIVAGAFQLKIDSSLRGLRLVEKGVNWRSQLCQLPYGDQALFLPAATFQNIGGFRDLPIMEDFDLVCRLKRYGKIAIAPVAVLTSARRYQKLGVLPTTLINQWVIATYFLGIPPSQIARWYHQKNQ